LEEIQKKTGINKNDSMQLDHELRSVATMRQMSVKGVSQKFDSVDLLSANRDATSQLE
jgi:hypothetical protein